MLPIDRVRAGARVVGDGLLKRALRLANRGRFESDLIAALPERLVPAARFAFAPDWTPEEEAFSREVESFRSRIASLVAGDTLASKPSPKEGDFSLDEHGRSQGARMERAPVAGHARTGVNRAGGTLLRRITGGLGAKRVLELGTNTGFSGCYFVSAPSKPTLITVEGSSELCEIARKNIGRFSQSFTVMNMLFDEAIDELQKSPERFDCAFIDGQHERKATLHYAARIEPLMQPSGVIVFDDVYWSADMNQAWKEVCLSPRYRLTLDLGWKGLAVLGSEAETKRHFDVCDYVGRTRIRPRSA